MISQAAVFEAVRQKRPLGNQEPITSEDLWARVAEDMSDQPWKSLAIDLLDALRRDHEYAVEIFIRSDQRIQIQQLEGRYHAREIHARQKSEAARRPLSGQIVASTTPSWRTPRRWASCRRTRRSIWRALGAGLLAAHGSRSVRRPGPLAAEGGLSALAPAGKRGVGRQSQAFDPAEPRAPTSHVAARITSGAASGNATTMAATTTPTKTSPMLGPSLNRLSASSASARSAAARRAISS